jgi:uncharacterized protein (TIGR03067 family)
MREFRDTPPTAANPAIALSLQSWPLVGRVAELGSLAASHQPKHSMKTLRNTLLIGLVACVISQAWGADSEATRKDMAQLQGEWSMVSGSADGQPMPDEMRKLMKRVCKGDEATVTMGAQVYLKAKITIDPSKKPKTIDYQMTDGVTKGKTQLGIYELDGDTFKSCFSAPVDPRPTDFTSKPGDRRTLSVWKREKPAAPAPEQK